MDLCRFSFFFQKHHCRLQILFEINSGPGKQLVQVQLPIFLQQLTFLADTLEANTVNQSIPLAARL